MQTPEEEQIRKLRNALARLETACAAFFQNKDYSDMFKATVNASTVLDETKP